VAKKHVILDPTLGPLTDDRLTVDVRVFQRERGHRFSSDDVMTAFVAAQTVPSARRILDLGCGLGSVLLHLAWSLPQAELVGIEAQEVSFELLRRNLARSQFSSRVTIVHGDLRERDAISKLGAEFDLITGTPPYFPHNTAIYAEDPQRAYARMECRGGVEAYVETALPLLAANGTLVLCADARAATRVDTAVAAFDASIVRRCDVIPRAQRAALFSVWTIVKEGGLLPETSSFVLRDENGERTPDANALRGFSGF
jgi:tRNA1(Val) A37 N6-methylase TrmN6